MNRFLIAVITLTLSSASFCTYSVTVNYYVIAKQAMPFQITETSNSPRTDTGAGHSGIVTEIVQAVFENSQYEVNYHTYPFNRMISKLNMGGKSNWITYGSPGWGGVQAKNLSDIPIYKVKHVLMNSKKKPFQFNTVDDIKNKAVVLLHGFDYPQLQPGFDDGSIEELRVKDYAAAFRIIKKLPGDTVFVEMQSRINFNVRQQSIDPKQFQMQSFSAVIPDYPIYLAFDPNMDNKIQKFINRRLTELKAAGKLDQIIEKYVTY